MDFSAVNVNLPPGYFRRRSFTTAARCQVARPSGCCAVGLGSLPAAGTSRIYPREPSLGEDCANRCFDLDGLRHLRLLLRSPLGSPTPVDLEFSHFPGEFGSEGAGEEARAFRGSRGVLIKFKNSIGEIKKVREKRKKKKKKEISIVKRRI